jgi:hypothetical protein
MNPQYFNNFEVRLRFDIAGTDATVTNLRQTAWTAYRGGTCTCLNTGADRCMCEGGEIFDRGLVGRVQAITQGTSTHYVNQMPFYLEEGGYWLVFNHTRFYPRAVWVQVNGDTRPEMCDVAVMVPRFAATTLRSARIVLNDGAVSSAQVTHTMFLVNTDTPKTKIIWESSPTISGLQISHSYASRFGEVITMGEVFSPLTWAFAVYCTR